MKEPFKPESLDDFSDELDCLITRFSYEYNIPFTAVIRIMQLKAITMVMDQREDSERDEDDEV